MKDWFESLEQREQIMVGLGAVAVVLMLVWVFVWTPLRSGAAEFDSAVAEKSRLLATLQRAQAIGGTSPSGAPSNVVQSLVVIVDQTHRNHGLTGTLSRHQPDGLDGVRVMFQGASFDLLIGWLAALQNDGVSVESATFDSTPQTGLVSATLVLRRS